ncbi:glycosyltransferase [Bacillus sp. Y1]|nr:glycosyltransferase [Bacillus sp. Y1]
MIINMNIGGTEKALLNMIAEMPKEKYDITFLMLEKKGGFLNSIPEYVKVEELREYRIMKKILNEPIQNTALSLLKEGYLIRALILLYIYLISKITGETSLLYKYLLRDVEIIKHTYDIAVAYAGPMDFISYFIVKKVKAEKKLQWIHFDITKIGFNKYFARKYYKMFNQIFVVSKEGKEKVVSLLPEFSDMTDEFINIVSDKLVKEMAEKGQGFIDDFEGIRILTVGRLSREKGQDLAIQVMLQIKAEGKNVKWYCVGDGNSRKEYEELINKYDLSNDFILLGALDNPYTLMKQCDIYVQPSRHEGYCITLSEAKCFNNTIICTNFTGAKEQLQDFDRGVVVEFNAEQLVAEINKVINSLEVSY